MAITDVYGNKEINTFQSLRNKMRLILKQCFNSTVHTKGYNFTTEQPITPSVVPIDVQLNVHSNSTNSSIWVTFMWCVLERMQKLVITLLEYHICTFQTPYSLSVHMIKGTTAASYKYSPHHSCFQ